MKNLLVSYLLMLVVCFSFTTAIAQTEYVPINNVAWSPDGTQIAVGIGLYSAENHDYSVQIRDFLTGETVSHLEYHPGEVLYVDWSPDGNKLVSSGGSDGIAVVWDVLSGEATVISQPTSLGNLMDVWSPEGTQIANVSDGNLNVNLWNPNTGQRINSFSTREYSFPVALAWSPDGSKLVTGHYMGSVVIWNSETGLPILEIGSHENTVTTVAWSPDGNYIATGSWDNTVRIWDATTGAVLNVFEQHANIVWQVNWSPDSSYLASASGDGTVRIQDVSTGEELFVFEYEAAVHTVDWSPDGKYIAFGGEASDGHDAELEIVEIPARITD